MSINPAQGIGASEAYLADAGFHRERPSSSPKTAQPGSGNLPKQEIRAPQRAPAPIEMPQDEVQVQRDNETNGAIVVKYLDHSGSVILQVPSSQVLGLMRAIDQDFQEAAKARANAGAAQAGNQGEKTHGH
jgi:hypothetical protein